ncbi:hypothetical protein JD844_017485 [Phrynosoma platyrhinos]|uniref:alpha-amylase n=1 Tax=Phrynosoma platyrhinos TaxID=52577 RepID=A0ABQ7SLX5_PHRPL|nr:hypothetical protein JD844_017485 [Phrynosoma platyrhinos]
MKSLLLLLIAAFGLCWTQYKSDPKPIRTSIVHLFEWRWTDVALECERYLAPSGFAGIQVNIYVDAVINHMCSSGAGSGYLGICGSYFNAGVRYFPVVPYFSFDFNDRICKTPSGDIENYSDPIQVRSCRLCGLVDLAQSREDVRSKIAGYMNHLIELGVAGFRIDASKHIWPEDINAIFRKVNNLNTRWFTKGSRPFIYQELGIVLRKWNGQKMANLKSLGENWSLMPSDKAIVFVDNHDNQRGHGAGGASILTFWNPRLYKMAVGFMLAHPYGFTRIMSSYRWPRDIQHGKDLNDWIGPPSNSDGTIKSVTVNPDGSCGNGWVCEHRWNQIRRAAVMLQFIMVIQFLSISRNMVIFRNVVHRQPITNWWDNNNNQVAFGRDGKGFIVFNNDDRNLSVSLLTGLPPGTYCDVISGQKEGNLCTGMQIRIAANGIAAFELCWAQYNPNTKAGRTSIVHLFEWRWADIALECERYLAPNGYGGVQISPPNENIIITNPWRPWWERYQPVSYKLCSRSGSENELIDMVTRCNNVGVHIYVDAVVNHMCGSGGGAGTHSTCGSYFNAGTRDFPAVPYSAWDFNDRKCKTYSGEIESYNDIYQVRDCRLVSLLDLALEKDYVRSTVANYMNRLIDIGVAGFRIDASKHMWPGDMKAFLDKLNNLNTRWFAERTRPFIFQEVIDLGGEAISASEYFGNGRVTEFKYGAKLGTVIRRWNGEKMAYLKNWGEGWGFMPSDKALVFVDNHDNQRGHGAGGASILTFWDARLYKMAVGFMLAHPYGFTRDVNDWIGPPSNPDGSTKSVIINPDTTCGNDWVCEHRWRQIRNMVIFRNVVEGQAFTNWWDNNSNQVAFGRGNKGFIVFNNDDWNLSETLQTGLPSGTYCDIISGEKEGNSCTGIRIEVQGDGKAYFQISNSAEDPFVAIHVNAKL